MEKEPKNNIKGRTKYYNEEKIDLFFDYNNISSDFENMNKEKSNNRTYYLNSDNNSNVPNCYNNYSISNNYYNSFNKNYNEGQQCTKINVVFNSTSLNEYLQNKKLAYDELSNSMNKILNKHKNEQNNLNIIYSDKNTKNNYNNHNNLNNIVEHLIKAYSKDELKLIKEKINNKVDEYEEEPQPEKLTSSFIKQKKSKNMLKLSSDSPSFLKANNNYNNNNMKKNQNKKSSNKDKNKNQFFKKINKSLKFKPIKINCYNNKISKNARDIKNKNLKNIKNKYKNNHSSSYISHCNNYSNNNIKFKPEFYTYIKCKTSFDYLDNFLKRQKSYKNYLTQKKINLTNNKNKIETQKYPFTPNISSTSGSNYSIKLDAQRLNESIKDKEKRMIYNSVQKKIENNKKLQYKYNKSFTFTPNIQKTKSKDFGNISKQNSIKKNITEKKELTPIKYVNHKFDYVTSIYKNDNDLLKRIKEQNEKKKKKFEQLKIESDNEKLEECTFKPDMSKTFKKKLSYNKKHKTNDNSHKKDKDNKSFTYVEFYQYKKNKGNSNLKNKDKGHTENKNKEIEKIGSLTPIVIPKKIKKTNSINKNNENDSFSIIHKLILENKP